MQKNNRFKKIFLISSLFVMSWSSLHADNMQHYMNIVNNIPKMEIKADPQSQAWARSARNIMLLTGESIAESLVIANQIATQNGQPLFCLTKGTSISAEKMNDLIQENYRTISGHQDKKEKLSVSDVALKALIKKYPCSRQHAQGFNHHTYSKASPGPLESDANNRIKHEQSA